MKPSTLGRRTNRSNRVGVTGCNIARVRAAFATGLAVRASAGTTLSCTDCSRTVGWMHSAQLLDLIGRQDTAELSPDVDLQSQDLLLLIDTQVQLLLGAGWK